MANEEFKCPWIFWQFCLGQTLESLLDGKEIKTVNPKGNQPWIFIGRTDAKAEAPILWPPDMKSQLIGKDPDAGKDWRQKEKGMTEFEMVRWHHRLNRHEFEQTPGDSGEQRSLTLTFLPIKIPWACLLQSVTEGCIGHSVLVLRDLKIIPNWL